jgi:hypothetical protein
MIARNPAKKFLTVENIPKALIQSLREFGHDVLSIKETMRGENDEVIL